MKIPRPTRIGDGARIEGRVGAELLSSVSMSVTEVLDSVLRCVDPERPRDFSFSLEERLRDGDGRREGAGVG